jgi:hypothetical protein
MKISVLLSSILVLGLSVSYSNVVLHGVSNQQPTPGTSAALSNKDVMDLVKAGLATEIITAKIKASKNNFDTSPTALQELKAAGVPDAIVLAMVEAPTEVAGNSPREAKSAEAPTTGDTKAIVYVYRKKNFNSRNMQPSVYVDGVEVARMDDGKFFIIKLDPGKHSLEVNKGHSGAQIDMKAGEQYYFRIDIKPGFWKGRSEALYMQKEQGSLEVQKMNPLEAKWIKDNSKVTNQP